MKKQLKTREEFNFNNMTVADSIAELTKYNLVKHDSNNIITMRISEAGYMDCFVTSTREETDAEETAREDEELVEELLWQKKIKAEEIKARPRMIEACKQRIKQEKETLVKLENGTYLNK